MKTLFFKTKINIIILLLVALTLSLAGCRASRTAKGGAIGATAGGILGGLIGSKSDNTAEGAIIGAALGGTAGALIGNYMDRQAEELKKDLENAKVERVGEGIKITFDSGLLFDIDSYQLKSETRQNLTDLSEVLNKYDDTEILIAGHTDSTGPDEYNLTLSFDRAESVQSYLKDQNVEGGRILIVGHGENDPVASNETIAGRQQNRRVEVAIYANKKLKRAAKRGDI
jgi:outer membrane protein OmpA-like peptidoglycan-associated protein